ncbi:HD domain-containing phosphohydrolase [Lysobacter panacisoli]|uniref:Two-component system response regulator n=1 Tax=Lysobacter panacisoli TaxID=1255263 RepID=A0ABP9L8N0_9GAMM|nr:HD domain-containing phosphohydrolase [Lysobacter panacisoli]
MGGIRFGKPTVLVVDDTPAIRIILQDMLEPTYRVLTAADGSAAMELLREETPDLILLDVVMPGHSGFEVCRWLKEKPATREVPVIFLTTLERVEDQAHGLELGAVDYITKPVHPLVLGTRVASHLRAKEAIDLQRDRETFLEREVSRRTQDMVRAQDVAILALTSLADTRDDETGSHSRRTQHFMRALAQQLKMHPRFVRHLDDATVELLVRSAPLHDIGKIGIPDQILRKPGRLTAEEYEVMKAHPAKGRDALQRAEDELGIDVPFLRIAKELAYGHHERWNGSGYPQGTSGDEIPVSARLMAIADVYDALTSRRAYKAGMPHEQAAAFIHERSGIDFDPDVVDAFVALGDKFEAITQHFAGEASRTAPGALA